MSGNEYFPARPHAAQDPQRIAAGSPLAILGLMLETLRERFAEGNGLDVNWRDDVQTTDIIIEAGYNTETESRNAARALYVNRLNTTPSNVVMNNHAGTHLPTSYEGFMCMMNSQITIDCVSNDAGDSTLLADIVQHFLIASRKIYEGWYGIHDFGLAEMGQTQPYTHEQEKWSTTVAVTLQYQVRWAAQKIRPLLQDIGTNLRDGTAVSRHVDVAVASMTRSALVTAVPASTPARTGYVHVQDVPSLSWTVDHALGFYPAITVTNASGYVVLPTSTYHETHSRTVLTFATATAGSARAL